MEWVVYGALFLIALAISASAIYAFHWASKNGEFRDFDAQSRVIFDDKEPEGVQTDFFPGRRPRLPASPSKAFRDQP